MSAKIQFDSLSAKKKSLGRVSVNTSVVDALEYIAANTEASKGDILEDALSKYGIVRKAEQLAKEINTQKEDTPSHDD